MEGSRTKKSIINLSVTMITQIGNILIKFIGRTLFIRILGVELLGINGLFTNILTLLSLAELGLGNAVIYSMYKPLKEKNYDKLAALNLFYKKIYRIIIIVILAFGVAFIPFLEKIVNLENNIQYLHIYYILFLIDTACSYVMCYKQSIINADQKVYILKIVYFCIQIIQFILQLIVLLIFKNYIIYIVIQICCTLLNNLICSCIANKLYPFINRKNKLTKTEQKDIFNNIKSLFLYKLSGTILNNTDNIFISVLIGTTIVGYYSNYYMVISSLNGIIYLILNSVTASIGNLMTTQENDKQKDIFLQLNLICFFLTGMTSIILFGIFNDFITLWIGKEYILSNLVIYITIINLYIYDMQIPVWIYRDTTGLFNDAKNATIIVTILNIVLSFVFGKIFGLFGILLATGLSRLLVTSWQQPLVLYKKVLKSSPKRYYYNKIYYSVILFIIILLSSFTSYKINVDSYLSLIIKIFVIFMVAFVLLYMFLFKTNEFKGLKERIKCILRKK